MVLTMFPPPGMFTFTFVIWLTSSPSRFCSRKKHYPLPKTMGYVLPQAPYPASCPTAFIPLAQWSGSPIWPWHLKVETVTFIPVFPEPSTVSDVHWVPNKLTLLFLFWVSKMLFFFSCKIIGPPNNQTEGNTVTVSHSEKKISYGAILTYINFLTSVRWEMNAGVVFRCLLMW